MLQDSLHIRSIPSTAEHTIQAEEQHMGEQRTTPRGTYFSAWRIIKSLPNDATPAQQDSAIQAHLPQRIKMRSTQPDTLNLPGWYISSKTEQLRMHVPHYDDHFFKRSTLYHPEIKYTDYGVVAENMPYTLKNDDIITSLILVCLLGIIMSFARSKRYFALQYKNFFLGKSEEESLPNNEMSSHRRYSLLLYFQTALLAAIIFYHYTQLHYDLFMSQTPPHTLLAIDVGCIWLFMLVRQMFYTWINWTFFNKSERKKWNKSYRLIIISEGLALFPLVIFMVFFNLEPQNIGIYLAIVVGIMKFLLLYKTHKTFFPTFYGFIHLIAYLCTVELLPLVVLWHTLLYLNDTLL